MHNLSLINDVIHTCNMQNQIYTQLEKNQQTCKNRAETGIDTLRIIQSEQQQPNSYFIIRTALVLQKKKKKSNTNSYKLRE